MVRAKCLSHQCKWRAGKLPFTTWISSRYFVNIGLRRMHEAVMICTCCWEVAFLPSDPASEVIMLSTLSTGGGAFLVKTQSTPLHKDQCAVAVSSTLWVRSACTDRSSSELKPTLHEPADPRCCFLGREQPSVFRCGCFSFFLFFTPQQKLRPRKPSGAVKREAEWSGNFCQHEHASGQPWYLQPVAAHGQRGHPQPPLLHQLVT